MATATNEEEEELSQLLAALATGVRAATRLPADEDEFRFCASLPEFQGAHEASQTALLDLLKEIVSEQQDQSDMLDGYTSDDPIWEDIREPLLWEYCADVCDAMLERIEQQLDAVSSATAPTTSFVQHARQQARSGLDRMIANTMEMSKPQLKFVLFPAHNHRTEPFLPKISSKPNALVPLDLTLQPMSMEHESKTKSKMYPQKSHVVEPSHFVPHVYRTEIEQLKCPYFDIPSKRPPRIQQVEPSLTATWIDTKEAMQTLVNTKLINVDRLALDLEAHSYRSFAGIVCLLQISFRDSSDNTIHNFLVDTLALHDDLHDLLLPLLTNPNIVKIMHGADSDIMWLQRDFSLYIVNLMDTGQAARALSLPSAGYAFLLQKYTSIKSPDKSFQLADWRKRPLSEEMQQYAIQDTHYLLDIYDCLLYDLDNSTNTSGEEVWQASKIISLSTYKGVPFSPNGYQKLLKQRGRNFQQYTPVQQMALQRLWDWRDATARALDESVPYIVTNSVLLRLATALPTNTGALQTLFNPMPSVLWHHATDVTHLLQRLIHQQQHQENDNDDDDQEEDELNVNDAADGDDDDEEDDGDDHDDEDDEEQDEDKGIMRRSAFFKPASTETRDGFASPVLGTEALYKQAGWMTPSEQLADKARTMTTSATEDETAGRDNSKPKRLLSVHPSNQDYRSGSHMEHSIGRGLSVDGMHTVRAVRAHSTSPVPNEPSNSDENQQQMPQQKEGLLGQKQPIPVVLGMIAPANEGDEEEGDVVVKDERGEADDTDDELVVPRSMREIYRISNRNRRNRKAGSLTPERGMTPTSEKERNELAKAELLLKERGEAAELYFSESSPKRPRTQTGRESEESVPHDSNDDEDVSFMQEIGWIKDPKEAEEMLETRFGLPKQSPRQTPVEYATAVGVVPAQPPNNPFFTGAALAGGTLTQGFARSARKPSNSNPSKPKPNNSRRQQERPEKKDGKSHAYRKK